jgi:predicted lipoprotein with Yx(FWY)xxD motif
MTHHPLPAVLVAGALLALAGCGGSTQAQSPSAAHGSSGKLTVAKTSLGKVLVDPNGMTVYELTSDSSGHVSCTGQCLQYWPPVDPAAAPAKGAVTAKLASTANPGGGRILTVAGHPVYTFVKDKAPGDVTGEGVKSFGGTWYALSANGHPVKASGSPAAPASSGSSTSGSSHGGGYGY